MRFTVDVVFRGLVVAALLSGCEGVLSSIDGDDAGPPPQAPGGDAGSPAPDGGGVSDGGLVHADGGDGGPAAGLDAGGQQPLVPNGQFRFPSGKVHDFIGGNYTDLGMLEGVWVPAEATADLQRLRDVGVDEVRIWASNRPGLDNLQLRGQRVDHIAIEAAKRGMTISVDLFDGATVGGLSVVNYRAMDAEYAQIVDHVVKPNGHHRNIQWSVGNEVADPWKPAEFADWYAEKAAQIRAAGGPMTQIIAELLPGSVNHPWANPVYEAAAKKVIAASDVVAVHYYPPNVATPADDGTIEHQSIYKWNELCRAVNRPFVIGEFNLHESYSSDAKLRAWVQHFYDLGVDHVSFWQFLKNEGGHVDPWSFDLVLPGHNRFGAIQDWMNKGPLDAGM
ncbi:MAG: cellulase family glycosylhydrolase [Myxococcaceae bacterium]